MIPRRSSAAIRSTLSGPMARRIMANTTPRKMRAAAMASAISVKGLLKQCLEGAHKQLPSPLRILGHDIEPVNVQPIARNVHDERSGSERYGVCQSQPSDWRFQRCLDLDYAWRDHEAPRID